MLHPAHTASTVAAGVASEPRPHSPPALPSAIPEQAQRLSGLSLPNLSTVSPPRQGDIVRATCSASRDHDPCPPAPDDGGRGTQMQCVRPPVPMSPVKVKVTLSAALLVAAFPWSAQKAPVGGRDGVKLWRY